MKKTLLALAILLTISICYSTESSAKGIHKTIDQLILEKDFDKAEKLALEAYKKFPNEPEAMCALACIYRNKSYKSAINLNLGAMGIKEGKTGTTNISLDSNKIRQYFKEKPTFDQELHKKAEDLYEKILKIDPTYENAYYNLLNDYVIIGSFDKYFALIDRFIQNIKNDDLKQNSLIDLASKLARNDDVDMKIAIRMYERIRQLGLKE